MQKKKKETKLNQSKFKTFWAKFLSVFKKERSQSIDNVKQHKKLSALIAIQYRDKNDTSWTKSAKTIIQKVVFFILKFGIITGGTFGLLKLVCKMFIIRNEIVNLFLIFFGLYVIFNLISVTLGLVKFLYLSPDNKVLSSLPVKSTRLFLSKILVFEFFELKKSLDILIPVTYGFLLACISNKIMLYTVLPWAILPLLATITLTVLLGALLSIPFLYIYKVMKKIPALEISLLLLIAFGVIAGLIFFVVQIPVGEDSINLNQSYTAIKMAVHNFSLIFGRFVYPVTFAFRTLIGESLAGVIMVVNRVSVGKFGILILVMVALFLLMMLIIKPFYFSMMTKTFEFEKKSGKELKIKKTEKHFAFIKKEFKLTFRNFEISASYLGVYIIAPIILLLINKTFAGMSTNKMGDVMVVAFNIILISLPILTSSTVVSTVFSREGRTAYIKKTKPIRPYFPLTAKFLFNLVFVVPSIIASCIVFTKFTNSNLLCAILLGFIVLMLEYGHIYLSASLDIMNPQNELYETDGSSISNPNEIKSIAIALVLSLFIGGLAFLFCFESKLELALLKILVISIVFAASCILLFYLNVKAFYIDRQEASK